MGNQDWAYSLMFSFEVSTCQEVRHSDLCSCEQALYLFSLATPRLSLQMVEKKTSVIPYQDHQYSQYQRAPLTGLFQLSMAAKQTTPKLSGLKQQSFNMLMFLQSKWRPAGWFLPQSC